MKMSCVDLCISEIITTVVNIVSVYNVEVDVISGDL